MRSFKVIPRELLGLFVEDGSFAVGILVWLILLGLVLPHFPINGSWRGGVLFIGLIVILIESVLRRTRQD